MKKSLLKWAVLLLLLLPAKGLIAQESAPSLSHALSKEQKTWRDLHYFSIDSTFTKAVEPEEGAARLEALKALYNDQASWQARRNQLEVGIREALLLPENTAGMPLPQSLRTKTIERKEGYTIENLALEILPGVWVTGNLYRPTQIDSSAKWPAILSAQGHGRLEPSASAARFEPSGQVRCALLAKMGAVVYHYDMFGSGESGLHFGHEAHRTGMAQAIQTFSSMRIIDYLVSLPYVDPMRIGMTGASGGGTQTFLATAVDPRIAVAVPVVQVSCFFPGGCPCESGRPIHLMCQPASNNAEITAMAAPRPLLVVSDGGDWTRTVDQVEYPFIKRTYSFYGKEALVENVHLSDEKHDYGPSKQVAMFNFMAKHLGVDASSVKKENDEYDFSSVQPIDWEELLVFPAKKLPQGHVTSIAQIYAEMMKMNSKKR